MKVFILVGIFIKGSFGTKSEVYNTQEIFKNAEACVERAAEVRKKASYKQYDFIRVECHSQNVK